MTLAMLAAVYRAGRGEAARQKRQAEIGGPLQAFADRLDADHWHRTGLNPAVPLTASVRFLPPRAAEVRPRHGRGGVECRTFDAVMDEDSQHVRWWIAAVHRNLNPIEGPA